MPLFTVAWAIATLTVHQAAPAAAPVTSPPADVDPASTTAGEADSASAAGGWIELIDTGAWEASWRAAAPIFRTTLTAAQWGAAVQAARQPFGAPVSRRLQSTTAATTLPGAPDGDYRILVYQARFTKRADAIETIVLSREAGGWQVSGYSIR